MPVVVVGDEKNFAALRPRLFTGRISRTDAREVADAIREANPDVNLDRLTPGTVLTVPDLPAVRVRDELSLDDTPTSGVAGLAQHAKRSLDELADATEKHAADKGKERRRVLKAMDTIGTDTRRPRDARLAKDLENARKALEDEEERAKERAATLKTAQAEWVAGLDALSERASRALPTG